jgi:hypothetical protein
MNQSIPAQTTVSSAAGHDLQRRDNQQFQAEMQALIGEAENMRMRYMGKHRGRSFLALVFGLGCVLAGGGGFGWFLLMEANLNLALLCIGAAIVPPLLMHLWAQGPLKDYTRAYKAEFMPKVARTMGGFQFYPERGIGAKILGATGVVPPFQTYKAEDCFRGVYKGVKVLMSEARLFGKQERGEPLFSGLLVLLEIPSAVIEGHTIITADAAMVQRWAQTRWKKLRPVQPQNAQTGWGRFHVYSDTPEAASLMVGERLIKELTEAADIFGNSALTAVLFRGKYVFMMIPHEQDMFEASNIFVPCATRQHAMNCKREIERILEIIDVFELYRAQAPL